jgi:hypothetical protein
MSLSAVHYILCSNIELEDHTFIKLIFFDDLCHMYRDVLLSRLHIVNVLRCITHDFNCHCLFYVTLLSVL